MERTLVSTAVGEAVVVAPSDGSPSVSPSQLAEATTWTTRTRRAGRLSLFTRPTLPGHGSEDVRRRE